jgi:predicted ATPase/DNA-binding winged helix-turn-helix (wHTH) protein
MPEQGQSMVYESGQWQVHLGRRELLASGVAVPIGARAFEIIEVLVRSANELVTKNDLMDRIWPGAMVGENTLQVHISAIRKAFGQDRAMLKTASGRGYRLIGDWMPRQQGAASRPVAAPPLHETGDYPMNNFPLFVGRLIGRDAAARHVRDLVSAYRVVTLTGPGGIGKTSLAIETARHLVSGFNDGGWFVELASVSDPDLVPTAVASALGLKLSGEVSAASVARAVGEKRLLLVLDNCEHVVDAAANLAERLIGLCPHTTILATSQEVLRIDGEAVWRVPPLDVPAPGPETPAHVLGHSAVELFIARLNALDVRVPPRAEDLPAIAAICRRLDGIPLAIEFAAASAATLGIEHVALGLRDRFALLTGGRRTAMARQRTLRATLDWSHELLPEAEQRLFRRLAVFQGGFTLDAAVAVMADTGLDTAMVMNGVAILVAKSLVALDTTRSTTRWYLLETIRAYGLEKLVEHGETDTLSGYHAVYFRGLVTPLASGARSSLSGDDLARCVREIDNVRSALDWSFSAAGDVTIGVHLTAAYAPVWLHLSLIGECRDRCERALSGFNAVPELDVRLQMELQIALASALIVTLGSPEETETVLGKALEIADAVDDLDAQARALAALSTAHIYHHDYDRARADLERLRQVAERIGDSGIVAVADRRIGTRLLTAGRLREARECFEHILETPLPPENQRPEFWNYLDARAMARAMLARALCLQGFAERAQQEARTSVGEVRATDHPLSVCRVLNFGMCRIASMLGNFEEATRAIAHSIETATRLNAPFWQIVGQFLQGKLLVDRHEFAEALALLRDAFDKCGQTGWRISYPEFKGALAAAHLGLGQIGEALDAVSDAIANSGPQHGQMWYLPELLRIKGETLLQQAADQAAEDCFDQAGDMAREQGALFWELRIALSVARLRASQGRRHEARALLASVYDRFTEGFATADLRAARAMLDGMPT